MEIKVSTGCLCSHEAGRIETEEDVFLASTGRVLPDAPPSGGVAVFAATGAVDLSGAGTVAGTFLWTSWAGAGGVSAQAPSESRKSNGTILFMANSPIGSGWSKSNGCLQ